MLERYSYYVRVINYKLRGYAHQNSLKSLIPRENDMINHFSTTHDVINVTVAGFLHYHISVLRMKLIQSQKCCYFSTSLHICISLHYIARYS